MAAAPSKPTAWVARAAAPGNSDADGDGEPVGTVPLPVGVGKPETELELDASVTVVDDTSVEVAVVVALASELGVGVGVGVALSLGTATVTPFEAQVSSTLEMTSASSAGVQFSLTQGVTAAKSESAFLQWQAKSSRFSQPSVVRGVMKQFNCHGR